MYLILLLLTLRNISICATELDLQNAISFVGVPHHGPIHPKFKNTLFVLNSTDMKAITFSSVSIPHKNNNRLMYFVLPLATFYLPFQYALLVGFICGFFDGYLSKRYYDYNYNRVRRNMAQLPPQLPPSDIPPHIFPLENLQYERPEGKALHTVMTNHIPWIKCHIQAVPRSMIKIEKIPLRQLVRVWPQGSLMGFEKLELTTAPLGFMYNNATAPPDNRLLCCVDNYRYIHWRRPERYSHQSILLRFLIGLGIKRTTLVNAAEGHFQRLTQEQRNNLNDALNDRFLKIANALYTGNRQLVTRFRMPYNPS